MTREEMLRELRLSEQEYNQLIDRFAEFFNPLNDNQKRVVNNWMPSREEIVRAFGHGVTVEELRRLSDLEKKCIGVLAIALKPGPGHEPGRHHEQ